MEKDERLRDNEGNLVISDKIQKELDEIEAFDKAQQSLQKQMDDRSNGGDLNERADRTYKRVPPRYFGTHRDLGRRPLFVPILLGILILLVLIVIAFSLLARQPVPIPSRSVLNT